MFWFRPFPCSLSFSSWSPQREQTKSCKSIKTVLLASELHTPLNWSVAWNIIFKTAYKLYLLKGFTSLSMFQKSSTYHLSVSLCFSDFTIGSYQIRLSIGEVHPPIYALLIVFIIIKNKLSSWSTKFKISSSACCSFNLRTGFRLKGKEFSSHSSFKQPSFRQIYTHKCRCTKAS